MSRLDSFHRVAHAMSSGDFAKVTYEDLWTVGSEKASDAFRAWEANDCQVVPLDQDVPDTCVDELLVRITTVARSVNGKTRLSIEYDGPLALSAGDAIFIRRATPLRRPEGDY